MIEPILMGVIVLYFFTREIFARPPRKSMEEQLGEALAKYLDTGVKIRVPKDD